MLQHIDIRQPFVVQCLGSVELDEGPREWVRFITGHVQSIASAYR